MTRPGAEPASGHRAAPAGDAVLLVNLGTPEAPTTPAVRRYLAEFLADPRVVELPRWLWLPILHAVILPLRPAQSAKKYAQIWTPAGSPLATYTARQAELLGARLAARPGVAVDYAMRYGNPSVGQALDRLQARGCSRILVLPLYPQYAASTTASVLDAVGAWMARTRDLPEIRYVRHFPVHTAYIGALAVRIRQHWSTHGRADRLLLSFHGLPRRTIELGDPYARDCHDTARRLAAALELRDGDWAVAFQSRFGKAKWIEPYTEPTLVSWARSGVARVDVACPGFVSDCLETLEEIDIAARHAFLAHGGKEFRFVPCLNDAEEWIRALESIVGEHLWSAAAHAFAAS